ncbi:MAG TPA: AI-2E family transporter [Alphaproteobacteria bacterium]|nr:AI-2E family transporter [Alphaproteobacteria bacterium]
MSDTSRRSLFWLAAAVLFVAVLYLFRDILLPFVLGMAIAYAFDPAADRLERAGVPRGWASAAIVALFFAAFAAGIVVLYPLLQDQIVRLVDSIPKVIAWVREHAMPIIERIRGEIRADEAGQLQAAAKSSAGGILAWLGKVVSGVWSGGLAIVNVISLLVVTPVVAFYLLRDWDGLVARIDSWLPRAQAPVIRAQAREIDRLISEWVRGVTSVCLILAVFYGACLTLVGLDFGLVIGISAGLISFIPFVGAITGFAAAIALALFQFQDVLPIALVVATFGAGQFLESYVLTPRLVGEKVGLHPVWVLFALFAAGALFGFVGVLLAVPAAAAIGVVARFAIERYLASPYYLGSGSQPPGRGDPER